MSLNITYQIQIRFLYHYCLTLSLLLSIFKKKFLDGSLEFDVQPTKDELKEVQEIVNTMNINNANFLYLK